MALQPGDVVLVWDHQTHPPKHKLHICICPDRQFFLRINSRPLWPPHMLLRVAESDFLEHDSYVELQQLSRLRAYDIQTSRVLGHLTVTQKRMIVIALTEGGWMSAEHIDMIRTALS